MYSDVAATQVTLDTDGYDQFEAVCEHDISTVRESLLDEDGVDEALVLNTCQRYEVYACGDQARTVLENGWRGESGLADTADRILTGEAAVEHLFRVVCGLESGILGEDEIIGQFRDAYRQASESGALGGMLDTISLKGLRAGERARTESAINEGTVSLGSVTVDRISSEVSDLADCNVLVVGVGDVGRQVLKSLGHRDVGTIYIANRTVEHAERLARKLDCEALPLEELSSRHLREADILVSATGASDRILGAGQIGGHDLVVFDLANPRDIDPSVGDCQQVKLVGIDEILDVRRTGLQKRKAAIPTVEEIIAEETDRLGKQLRAERIDDALNQIYSRSHELRETEFEQALSRLDAAEESLSETQEQVMQEFSEALINKLLHPKTAALRQAAATGDRETVDAWLTLFDQKDERSQEPAEQSTTSM